MSLKLWHPHLPVPFDVAAVHAASTVEARRGLWDGILRCNPEQQPWIVVRDFNVILESEEKRKGRLFRVAEARDFVEFMSFAGLLDGGYLGSTFTW